MNKQNMDSLENFFQEGAQKYQIEFNEGDWHDLEAKLNREMPVAFSFKYFLKKYWPLTFALLLVPLSWYSYNFYSTKMVDGSDTSSDGQRTPVERPLVEASVGENKSSVKNGVSDQIISGNEPAGAENNLTRNNVYPYESTSHSENNISIIQSEEESEINHLIVRNDKVTINDYATYTSGNMSELNFSETRGITLGSSVLTLSPINPQPVPVSFPSINQVKSKEEVIPSDNTKQKIAFYVGVGLSPDFSTVGLGNFIAPGFRWALTGEVGLSKRFLLNTGLIWVKNKYEAYGEDYHAPARYWKNGIVADEAYGECIMIDIPLNLRYNVWAGERHQVFVTAGVSTYFLLKEDYYFHYEKDDPDLPQHWGTDKISTYPFKIVNFSFGYQYLFGRKGSLQVEPFIKLPTAGVGWGNVDLHTIGVYFLYKYRLGK